VRPLFFSLAVVVVCFWAGYELRSRYPQVSVALYTLGTLLGLLGGGAFYGAY
jgi:hypothetical protein